MTKTVLVIGGYGNAGLAISKLLLKHTDLNLVIAGRNLEKAQDAASKRNEELSPEKTRCSAQAVDASDAKSLDQAFANVDFVLVASSTSKYSQMVVEAATRAKIDLFDILSTTHTMEALRSMEPEIKAAGSCIITGGGVHPGMPGVLARCAAGRIAHPTSVRVGMLFSQNWGALQAEVGEETVREFLSEVTGMKSASYENGTWKEQNPWMSAPVPIDFGGEFKKRQCISVDLEEMHEVPALFPDIQEVGFSMAGLGPVIDFLLVPFIMLSLWVRPASKVSMQRLLYWGLKKCSSPPYGTVATAEAKGTTKEGKETTVHVTVSHEDGYFITAAPVVASIKQYLSGSIRRPGLWLQGCQVEPEWFLKDIEDFGVKVKVEEIEGDE